jgi:hypothetical protein
VVVPQLEKFWQPEKLLRGLHEEQMEIMKIGRQRQLPTRGPDPQPATEDGYRATNIPRAGNGASASIKSGAASPVTLTPIAVIPIARKER